MPAALRIGQYPSGNDTQSQSFNTTKIDMLEPPIGSGGGGGGGLWGGRVRGWRVAQ